MSERDELHRRWEEWKALSHAQKPLELRFLDFAASERDRAWNEALWAARGCFNPDDVWSIETVRWRISSLIRPQPRSDSDVSPGSARVPPAREPNYARDFEGCDPPPAQQAREAKPSTAEEILSLIQQDYKPTMGTTEPKARLCMGVTDGEKTYAIPDAPPPPAQQDDKPETPTRQGVKTPDDATGSSPRPPSLGDRPEGRVASPAPFDIELRERETATPEATTLVSRIHELSLRDGAPRGELVEVADSVVRVFERLIVLTRERNDSRRREARWTNAFGTDVEDHKRQYERLWECPKVREGAERERDEARAELERLRAAVEFYADPDKWRERSPTGNHRLDFDRGDIARAALAQARSAEQPGGGT